MRLECGRKQHHMSQTHRSIPQTPAVVLTKIKHENYYVISKSDYYCNIVYNFSLSLSEHMVRHLVKGSTTQKLPPELAEFSWPWTHLQFQNQSRFSPYLMTVFNSYHSNGQTDRNICKISIDLAETLTEIISYFAPTAAYHSTKSERRWFCSF